MKENYLRSVRALLDCPAGERERLLTRLDSAVTAYLEDVPEAGEADLSANFGTPEECAARLLEECAGPLTERRKKIRRRRICTAFLVVLLLLVAGIAAYCWSQHWIVRIRLDY